MRSSPWLNRRFFLASLAVLHLVCALQSGGWYAPDEHYQTLEYAVYKLGANSTAELPWEFYHQMRPALQPSVAYFVIRTCQAAGVTDPFVASTILRLLSGLLGVLCQYLLFCAFEGQLKSTASRAWFAATSCLLWLLPYQHVRFASESWSGSFFWLGTALAVLLAPRSDSALKNGLWILAGFVLGLSVVARVQGGLLVAPVLVWLVLGRPFSLKPVTLVILGAAVALLVGVVLDRWLYGEWTVSAWHYFRVNILEGKAAHFGTDPWWFYFARVAERGVYPVGLAMLVASLLFVIQRPRHLVTWILVPFVVVHTLIAHKEVRFLFPLVSIMPFVLVAGFEPVAQWLKERAALSAHRIASGLLYAVFALNVLVAIAASLKPAEPAYNLYRFLYRNYGSEPFTLLYATENPYERAHFASRLYPPGTSLDGIRHTEGEVYLETRFYRPEQLTVSKWDSTQALPQGKVLYVTKQQGTPSASGMEFHLVYSYLPDWLWRFNFTGWMDRTLIWRAYEVNSLTPR